MKNSFVIYRKYRPQNFKDVIGQEHLIKTITYSLSQNKPAHAYLFSGTRGVGKTTVARLIAKGVNCEKRKKGSYEPCNQCASCQAIDQGTSVDFLELDAASHRGIEEAKALIESVKYPPTRSPYKVFVIDEVHMLTREAFNSLLKTLEEPPAYAIFILATTEPQKVPQTIISRCQYFEFKRLRQEQIREKVKRILKSEKIKMDTKSIDFIARSGRGSMRDTESLLEQVISQSKKTISWPDLEEILGIVDPKVVYGFLKTVFRKDRKETLAFIHRVFNQGKDLSQFAFQVVNYLREMVLAKVDKELLEGHNLSKEEIEEIEALSKDVSEDELLKIIELFSRAEKDVGKYPLEQMALEIAALEAIGEIK